MSERSYPEFPGASYDAWKTTPPYEGSADHYCDEEACSECDLCLVCGDHASFCTRTNALPTGGTPGCAAGAEPRIRIVRNAEGLDEIEVLP